MSVQVRLRSVGREVLTVPNTGVAVFCANIPANTGTARVFFNPEGQTGTPVIAMLYDPATNDPTATDGIVFLDTGGYLELPSLPDVRQLRISSLDANTHSVLVMYHGTQ